MRRMIMLHAVKFIRGTSDKYVGTYLLVLLVQFSLRVRVKEMKYLIRFEF
jgi:general stress protein CsbA